MPTSTLFIFSLVHSAAPMPQGPGQGSASMEPGGRAPATSQASLEAGRHPSSTSFVEDWRVPTPLPKVWARY